MTAESRLPDGRGLVWPARGDTALAAFRLRYLKQTIQQYLQAVGRLPVPPEARTRLAAAIRQALAKDPKAALDCFASPAVGAPLHCLAIREHHPWLLSKIDRAFADSAANLLLELSARELLPAAPIDWPAAPELVSPSLGVRIAAPKDASAWRFGPGHLTAVSPAGAGPSLRLGAQSLVRGRPEVQGLRVELAYVPIGRRIRLALVDTNPIAEFEAHPDKTGSALDLGRRSEDDWRESLATALDWIREHAPAISDEMESTLVQAVPVGYQPERHFSASYREAIGTVYLTLHPNPLTMAEALIHEFQHNKANIASYSDGLLLNAFQPLYKSPVRPDPRPLWGILLAAHAFLPVAAFYRALRDAGHPVSLTPDFGKRLDDVDLKNREGMDVIRAHAEFTVLGRQMMDALDELDQRHMRERLSKGLSVEPTSSHA